MDVAPVVDLGRYPVQAAVGDPAGAVFWIIENDGTGSPDRAD